MLAIILITNTPTDPHMIQDHDFGSNPHPLIITNIEMIVINIAAQTLEKSFAIVFLLFLFNPSQQVPDQSQNPLFREGFGFIPDRTRTSPFTRYSQFKRLPVSRRCFNLTAFADRGSFRFCSCSLVKKETVRTTS